MILEPERRDRWIRSIAEGARQEISSALGLLESADDPGVRETFRSLVQQLEAVHKELRDLAR
jgi:hypothetical protein